MKSQKWILNDKAKFFMNRKENNLKSFYISIYLDSSVNINKFTDSQTWKTQQKFR